MNKTFVSFYPADSKTGLPQLCCELLDQQRVGWSQMAEGYEGLKSVRVRELLCGGSAVKVQFNPKRIKSTGANIDPKAIQDRKCFLCLDNLPQQQQGILYRNDFLILCNPAPIFSQHFTFSCIRHVPQELEPFLEVLFDLARDLSPDFTVFYNGPKCGASAPDHVHFQISPWRAIPVELDAVDMQRRRRLYYKNHVAGCSLINYGRSVLIVESSDKDRLHGFLGTFLAAWKKELGLSDEPMMNLLCSYQQDIWRCIIFPRRKHRPDVYFKEGGERIMISPAAVDIGGFIVLPVEEDFLRIDAKLIESIFMEVCTEQGVLEKIVETLF